MSRFERQHSQSVMGHPCCLHFLIAQYPAWFAVMPFRTFGNAVTSSGIQSILEFGFGVSSSMMIASLISSLKFSSVIFFFTLQNETLLSGFNPAFKNSS